VEPWTFTIRVHVPAPPTPPGPAPIAALTLISEPDVVPTPVQGGTQVPFSPIKTLRNIVTGFCGWVAAEWAELKAWLGPDVTAVAGKINLREFAKAVILGISSGGGALTIMQLLAANADRLFVDAETASQVAGWVGVAITFVDMLRRRSQHSPVMPPPESKNPCAPVPPTVTTTTTTTTTPNP
jgi:hypothetical protein